MLVCILGCLLLLSGCSSLRFPGVFRIDIGQGNIITKDMIEKLEIGMTKKQVEYVTGSAMIKDPFTPNRWDYVYNYETGQGALIENRLTLFFENDQLKKIDDSRLKDPENVRKELERTQLIERDIDPDKVEEAREQANPDHS